MILKLKHCLITLIFCYTNINAQNLNCVNIFSEGSATCFSSEKIDSITFSSKPDKDFFLSGQQKYDLFTQNFCKELTDTTIVYHDFSLSSNTQNVNGKIIQSGQKIYVSGAGAKQIAVQDGKVVDEENFYLYTDTYSPLKYIGMSFSYSKVYDNTESNSDHIQPCVIMLGKREDTWSHIIHILFYRDNLAINRRDGEGFIWDCKKIEGNGIYPEMALDSVYNVSVFIKEDTLYIKKPDNTIVSYQNEYFKDTFVIPIWQVYNMKKYNHHGFIHEIYAGTKPFIEATYRTRNKLRQHFNE
ncbi:MAG: hypothetical protein K6E54_07060 [Bacteroidaceae bacterium]|nr:hypothetical protein [Bacteroidaceae bacterium]